MVIVWNPTIDAHEEGPDLSCEARDVIPMCHIAKSLGVSKNCITDLVRALKIPTHKVPGLIAAKGIDSEGRARIRRALEIDETELSAAS